MTTAGTTVLFGSAVSTVEAQRRSGEELWLRVGDVPTAVGWEVKPEGVCAGEVCVPLEGVPTRELVERRDGEEWLDVAGFARHVGQPYARSEDRTVWSFGAPRHEWERWGGGSALAGAGGKMAPAFALPDMSGRVWSLSEFRKRKVFLVTWASW